MTTARLRLVASIALAASSSSMPASSASPLVKLPVDSGRVTLYRVATAGTVQPGAWPASSRIAARARMLSSWSATISVRRREAMSIQAPSSGPLSTAGITVAAAVSPASAGLRVRCRTSSTPAVLNIDPATRDRETVTTKLG